MVIRWKDLSIIYKACVPLFVIFIIGGIVSYYSLDGMVTLIINDGLERQVQEKFNIVRTNEKRLSRRALELASVLSNLEEVKTIYRMEDENIGRDALRDFFTPLAENIQKNMGVKAVNVHFHKPPAKSFLRTWREKGKKDGGDDLTGFRNTILQVSKTKEPVTGIELGRGGFVVRGIAPIFDGDEYLGSVEMFYDFNPVIEYSQTGQGQNFALFMGEHFLNIANRLADKPRIGSFLEVITTAHPLMTANVTEADIRQGKDQVFIKRNPNMIMGYFPVKDYKGEPIGVMVYTQDTTNQDMMLAVLKTKISIGIGLVMILLLVVLALVLRRVIVKPLEKAAARAEAIKKGDLDQRLHWDRKDELGRLAQSFDQMSDSLQEKCSLVGDIMNGDLTCDISLASDQDSLGHYLRGVTTNLNAILGQIQQAADLVATDAGEISDTSQTLSHGASEQAASIEEISSSMTEIGRQTSDNADQATTANGLVLDVREAAEHCNRQMQEMITAMADINGSSREVAKIIKAIDDIAFQTNLLALNAAVEAARAGKYGKGFAVVAQEVRSLAQRSAQAAQETNALIEQSVKKVEYGSGMVDKTAQALLQMVEGVTNAAGIVGNIADASNVQAQNISQINQGLQQIEQVTQNTSAQAEQTASSAIKLNSQAEMIHKLISRFKIKQHLTHHPEGVGSGEALDLLPDSAQAPESDLDWAPASGKQAPQAFQITAED